MSFHHSLLEAQKSRLPLSAWPSVPPESTTSLTWSSLRLKRLPTKRTTPLPKAAPSLRLTSPVSAVRPREQSASLPLSNQAATNQETGLTCAALSPPSALPRKTSTACIGSLVITHRLVLATWPEMAKTCHPSQDFHINRKKLVKPTHRDTLRISPMILFPT